MMIDNYCDSDDWSGGAWITSREKSAVIFVGNKGTGKCWYGFANGLVWPLDCAEQVPPTCPEVPEWPYDNRGWWSEGLRAEIIFYDPSDLAAVAAGTKKTWEPQPYASLDFTKYLFDPETDLTRYKRSLVKAASFDRANRLLYIFEMLADDDKSLVHVFKVR